MTSFFDIHRTFFQDRTNSCRRGSPLAKPSNLPCAPQALVAGSRRWRHRVRLDEAVISSAEGASLFGLCEPLSPSPHLPTRVAPPPSRRCQSLTTGARGRGSRLVPVSSSSLATFKEGLQGAPPARIFARKMDLLSAAQNFFRCAGLTGWRLAAQETFLMGRRARKSGWKSVLAQNRRGSSPWSRKSRCGAPTLQATQVPRGAGEYAKKLELASLAGYHPFTRARTLS